MVACGTADVLLTNAPTVGHESFACPKEAASPGAATIEVLAKQCVLRYKAWHVGQLAYSGHADSAIVIWRLFRAGTPTRPCGQQDSACWLPNWPVG